ncbi:RelA/SpoT domain-containing protein [Streptomyces olivaceoviridis]|uniref:RelA/SpoT domain-containing protein n=1 Tax=Streptomyces olivaceoviridis TaxID=1921 RepID=UPI003321205A
MPLSADEAFQRYQRERPRIEEAAEATKAHLEHHTALHGIPCEVTARAKEVSSFNTKMYRKGYTDPWKEITDKAGLRVIVPHRGLLTPALKLIKECLDVRWVEDDRDTPGDEDRLRYPRLHIQAFMVGGQEDPDGVPYDCEIQLRTEAVDLWSRMSHKLLYKPGTDVPPDVRRSLYRLIALVELFDLEVERGVEAMAKHPELARSNQLLDTAEQLYRTFTGHPYSTELSHDVINVLAQTIEDTATYSEQLTQFTERFRERLERNYTHYGPTSALFLDRGRYLLASQPESLIIFERLSNVRSRFELHIAWKHSELPETMLTDMAHIWGIGL